MTSIGITGTTGQIVPEKAVLEFKSHVTGNILVKGEASKEEYEAAIQRFNQAFNKEAAVIVFVETEEDVVACLKFVQEWKIDFTIACGRHNYWGVSGIEGGLVIDLRKLNKVSIDKENLTATAGGGCVAADLEIPLHEQGLYAVFGAVNDTGIGGLTLGGGTGFLTGQYGSTCDNLIAARVVLADGRIVEASESINADLFWGLRGGGSNFGVVTQFKYKVYKERGDVYFGPLVFAPDKSRQVLEMIELMREWTAKAEGKLAIFIGFGKLPGMPSAATLSLIFYDGPEEEARQIAAPLFELGPQMVMAKTMPLVQVTTPSPLSSGPKSHRRFATGNTAQALPIDVAGLEETVKDFNAILSKYGDAVAPSKMVMEIRSHAKTSSVPISGTALATRGEVGITVLELQYDDTVEDSVMQKEAATLIKNLRERGKTKKNHSYATVNANLSSGSDRLQDVFGENLPKLRQLKKKYDPNFIFNKWHPIPPAED